jgi:2',3'-cyclic-nucleotide 2'-phosphodiesterase (5'-nucleotidase family)
MKNLLIIKKIFLLSTSIIFAFTFKAFAQDRITVVYTNSLNGHFDDCGCKENPNGGLVMRAEEIKKIKASFENVFLFETGDFLASESDDLLINYLIKSYKYIGYDSIAVGDQEFSGNVESIIKNSQELPFVCNNILIQSGGAWKTIFNRFQILEKNNIKIGIIGTISNTAFKYYPEKITKQIKILGQVKEINDDINALKKSGVKFIFLLSHSGYDEDIVLAKKVKGIDLIIGGHSQTLIKEPGKSEPIIVQAGADGARIGILELSLNGKMKMIRNSFRIPRKPSSKEDSVIRKFIDEYNNKVREDYKKIKFK